MRKGNFKKIVREDGKVFDSIKAAAESVGVTHSSISQALRKGTPCKGYIWDYYVDEVDKNVDMKERRGVCQEKRFSTEWTEQFAKQWEEVCKNVRERLERLAETNQWEKVCKNAIERLEIYAKAND